MTVRLGPGLSADLPAPLLKLLTAGPEQVKWTTPLKA
jgi:hypothetical protein